MGNEKLSRDDHIHLEEYKLGEKLRDSYFRISWITTSIILPVCFSLVGLSVTEWLIDSSWIQLLPLALASLSLAIFWRLCLLRYGGFLATIYLRLQDLERDLGMNLHKRIDEKDKAHKQRGSRVRMYWTCYSVLGVLAAVWVLRLVIAYLHV